jgi:DNA-binding transcriptional ArsR family regulator
MPYRALVRREMAHFLAVLSHPGRLALIDALEGGEQDVNTLAQAAEIAPSTTSQHLAVLRAHRLVAERREGRHVLYHLTAPRLAAWLADGLAYVEAEGQVALQVSEAVRASRKARSKTRRAVVTS